MAGVPTLPAYYRIAEALREQITAGALAANAPVPSERDLAERFGVSRMTARQAIGVLEREGAVHRIRQKGTFVAPARIPVRIGSFSAEMRRRGLVPGAERVELARAQADAGLAAALEVPEGEPLIALERVRTADGAPIAIERTWLPAARWPTLGDEPPTGSIWELLRERAGVVPTRAEASMEVVALDEIASERLGATLGTAGLLLTRRTFDADGRCFEYARDVYRGDRVQFLVDAAIGA